MRFYEIIVSNPSGGAQLLRATSLGASGRSVPGALQVELDIVSFNYAVPLGGSYVKIWGVPLKVVSQATNLNYANISVRGGMSKGLPLANPAQQGLLARGTVLPAFGNWIGLEQTIDLVLAPPLSAVQDKDGKPPNLVLNWTSGAKMSDALRTALATAYPGFGLSINLDPNLVASADQGGFYPSLEALSTFLRQRSRSIINRPSYPGVGVAVVGDQIVASDGSPVSGSSAKQILFSDLIGQPTWMTAFTLQFKCPMRGDLAVFQRIKMPATPTAQTAAAALIPRNRSAFQGEFLVTQVRHTGNFRQADAYAWVTTVDALQLDAAA